MAVMADTVDMVEDTADMVEDMVEDMAEDTGALYRIQASCGPLLTLTFICSGRGFYGGRGGDR